MKGTRNLYPQTLGRILYIGILLIHFLMLVLGANAQTARQKAVREIYTSQIGVREKYANSGVEVEKYLRYVNLAKGNPWCAAFVCWVYGRAGVVNPRSGWTPDLFGEGRIIWKQGAESGKVKSEGSVLNTQLRTPQSREERDSSPWQGSCRRTFRTTTYSALYTSMSKLHLAGRAWQGSGFGPRSADIFGLYFPEKGRIAHVGFVDEWKDPWVVTVEGNTNVLGSREGDGVYRKRRLTRSIYKLARYIN